MEKKYHGTLCTAGLGCFSALAFKPLCDVPPTVLLLVLVSVANNGMQ